MQQAIRHSLSSSRPTVVLLVEDHAIYREVMHAALGKYLPAVQLMEAESVATALEVLQSRRIDVMVADMTLADGSAVELVEQAGPFIAAGVKVIVFSSHSTADMLPVVSRDDVHGYVAKEDGLKALAVAILATVAAGLPATVEPELVLN